MSQKIRERNRERATKQQGRLRRFGYLAASLLLAGLFASSSFAHVQKTAVTRILFNTNTGNMEVMHRFLLHDAEHAATLVFGERQRLLESAESLQLFSNYVINRFSIEATYASGDSRVLPLQHIGEEIDGQFVWIYQEIPIEESIQALTIVNMALRDVWPDQSNLVNIERGGEIRSLTFDGAGEVKTVEF